MIDQFALVDFGTPTLRDANAWNRNVEVVRLLCGIAHVTRWFSKANNETDYPNVPYEYVIDEVSISFLPHWGFYKVGDVALNLPTCEQDVLDAVVAIKTLKRLGMALAKK
jgi:hypothetical protein